MLLIDTPTIKTIIVNTKRYDNFIEQIKTEFETINFCCGISTSRRRISMMSNSIEIEE